MERIRRERQRNIGNLRNAPKRFIKEEDLEDASEKILASIKQAHEYYAAARETSLLTTCFTLLWDGQSCKSNDPFNLCVR